MAWKYAQSALVIFKNKTINYQLANNSSTYSAIARLAVSAGDSIPNNWTRPSILCDSGPCMQKSAGFSPSPLIFGRIPEYAGDNFLLSTSGKYARIEAANNSRLNSSIE